METQHDPLCDANHTARQACNRLREVASEPLIVSAPVRRSPPPPTAAAPPPPIDSEAPVRASHPDGTTLVHDVISDSVPAETDRPTTPAGAMPEPSPWASRAWEDTAAAVGATATQPAPPQARLEAHPSPAQRRSALPVIGALAAVAALVLLARRRG